MRKAMVRSIVLASGCLGLVSGCSSASAPPAAPLPSGTSPAGQQGSPQPSATRSQQPGQHHPAHRGGSGGVPANAWRGQFTGYGSSSWQAAWGYLPDGNFGDAQLAVVSDSSAPGAGLVLRVKYGQGSSANSCDNCPNPGGAQFYTSFAKTGRSDLASAGVLFLRYYVKFEAGFDFGRGGKLPGLYGGPVGQESGGHHGQAFSTRYMWRNHPVTGSLNGCTEALPCSEVYTYSPKVSSGYGGDVGGRWNWQGDGRWHMVEQAVNRLTGTITVWYDGKRVLSAPGALGGIAGIQFSGVFFSTFFGGHDASWGPHKNEFAEFADFAVGTSYIGG